MKKSAFLVLLLTCQSLAFQVSRTTSSRRQLLEQSVVGILTLTTATTPAWPSGGATAGGAYLLSAKQRYNDRVTKGIVAFKGLAAPLESGNVDAIRDFFATEEAGGWKDFSSAGYLLANAFRRSSSTAPDALPSVKSWKAFAANVEGMTKALKKKDVKGATKAYQDALTLLDSYLEKVELPPAAEIV